ncbi:hypothetical protein ABK040_009597 [Willaertia magna]
MWRFPGEFENVMESIWLGLGRTNHSNDYKFVYKVDNEEPLRYSPFHSVQVPMMESLLTHNNTETEQFFIDLVVHDLEKDSSYVKQLLKQRGNLTDKLIENNIRFHEIPHDDIWFRDMGPIFLVNEKKKERKIIDFGFNNWSYSNSSDEDAIVDESVDRIVASKLKTSIVRSSLISEGGNREFDGKGTLMMVEHVELLRNKENHYTNRESIESEMKRVFSSISKVIWLKTEGLIEDQLSSKGIMKGTNYFTTFGTGGHIDEFCRFIDENTIALAQVDDEANDVISNINRERLEENYELLKNETNEEGKPFRIVRMPVSPHMIVSLNKDDVTYQLLSELTFEDESIMNDTIEAMIASSYLNFLVCNHVVLISSYWREGRSEKIKQLDEKVFNIFKELYPNRVIVPINTEGVNIGGGGMHCISQQMPRI